MLGANNNTKGNGAMPVQVKGMPAMAGGSGRPAKVSGDTPTGDGKAAAAAQVADMSERDGADCIGQSGSANGGNYSK